MSASMPNPNILKKAFGMMHAFEYATVNFDVNGMTLTAMDPSHVAFVMFQLAAASWTDYTCHKPTAINVRVLTVLQFLKFASDTDSVFLSLAPNANHMTFLFGSANGNRSAVYKMPLFDIDKTELFMPDIDYDATVTMDATVFSSECVKLQRTGPEVVIDVNRDNIAFTASDSKTFSEIIFYDGKRVKISCRDMDKLTFPTQFLPTMTKSGLVADVVCLNMKEVQS
jgi:proliferating cell nuclear antigen PCNA